MTMNVIVWEDDNFPAKILQSDWLPCRLDPAQSMWRAWREKVKTVKRCHPKRLERSRFLASCYYRYQFVCSNYFQACDFSPCYFTHTEVWVIKKQREKAEEKASELFYDKISFIVPVRV